MTSTTLLLLLLLQTAPTPPPRTPAAWERVYHPVTIASLAHNSFTHVELTGRVTLVRREEDGDIHIRLEDVQSSDQHKFVVVEVIPEISLTIPKVGDVVRVRGIHRYDRWHHFQEIHPAEAIEIRPPVPTATAAPEKKP